MEASRQFEEERERKARSKRAEALSLLNRNVVHYSAPTTKSVKKKCKKRGRPLKSNISNRVFYGIPFFDLMPWRLRRCAGMIHNLMKDPQSQHFLLPVNLSSNPEYADAISEPMDFSTIQVHSLSSSLLFSYSLFSLRIRV